MSALVLAAATLAPAGQDGATKLGDGDAWKSLPFTAREWARQTLLPYRRIPLKNGGTMSVQRAYDLYIQAGQPEYPDMDTPGLVTPEEVAQQVRLSRLTNGR